MPTFRVPVLVWQDHEGFFTAACVETHSGDDDTAALGKTAAEALTQLKSHLNWLVKRGRCGAPDFLDPELIQVSVPVRPQYEVETRVFSCKETIELRFPCVHAYRSDGLLVCSLPTLGIGFYLHDRDTMKRMISERIRMLLAEHTPMELSRMLPPRSVRLDHVSVLQPRAVGQEQASAPPTLGQIAQTITATHFRKQYSAAHQRSNELLDLAGRLGKEQANVVLVGEHGSGKTTLLVNAARSLERLEKPTTDDDSGQPHAQRHRFWLTSAPRLVAGMKYLGQWEERCEKVIEELSEINGVLCVESLLDLVRLGGSGPGNSIAAFLLPYLENRELRLVAEATAAELDACRRLLPGLVDFFQILSLREMCLADARQALTEVVHARSRDLKIAADEQVPATVCRLYQRFMPYQALPGGASAFVKRLFERARQDRRQEFGNREVIEHFLEQTGLPEFLLHDDQPLLTDEVEGEFRRRIIGQPEACRTMAELIATFKAGLDDPQRPIGTLLFCGPTGVGKTELAKVVSRYLFGHGKDIDRLVRLDMSEYSAPWNAERLITKDDGTPSDFLARVRQQPFVVVLLDEIEKAAAEVFDILLGLLDEGRLTDRFGRTTNFRSAIVIMTSNVGASSRQSIGFSADSAEGYEAEVRAFFRPEFFNRLDAVLTFRALDTQSCQTITRKELDEIASREGFAKANLRLSYTDRLVENLMKEGFDPRYGARPLQRVLETNVVSAISRYLVAHPGIRDAEIQLDVDDAGQTIVAV